MNHCSTCIYKRHAPNGAHCYMFKTEPAPRCRQWEPIKIALPARQTVLERVP